MQIADMLFDYYSPSSPIKAFTKSDEGKDLASNVFAMLYNNTPPKGDIAKSMTDLATFKSWTAFCNGDVFASMNTASRILSQYYSAVHNTNGESQNTNLDFIDKISSQAFADFMNKEMEVISATGLFASAGDQTMSPQLMEKRAKNLDRIIFNPRLAKFISMFGSMKKSLEKSVNESKFKDSTNITNVELGADMRKLMASERLGLVTPELAMLKLYQFSQSRLMQYRHERVQSAGHGHIVLMLDTSSSMSEIIDRENELSAMDLAAIVTAVIGLNLKKSKRRFSVGLFNDRVYQFIDDDKFSDFMEVMNWAMSIQPSGGTSFENVFRENRLLNKVAIGYDVCMITDGYAALDESACPTFFELLKTQKLHTFKVMSGGDQYHKHSCVLDSISSSLIVGKSVDDFEQFMQNVVLL